MRERIVNRIRGRFWTIVKRRFPFFWVKHLYKKEIGGKIDFSNPKDINEKIIWLEFYTDTRLWSRLADKYEVREYVKARIGESYLVKLYGRWSSGESIDFDLLPEKFAIKPNNGSYDSVIVKDKSKTDTETVRKKLVHSLSVPFGYETAEPHYLRIEPCIIAEQLLESSQKEGLVDYKILCFDGKPFIILVCFNRDLETHHADLMLYDLDWVRHPEWLSSDFKNDCDCPKPKNLEKMIEIAAKLSVGLPQCRVDLYNIDGKIYFGEMTLTSNYGMMIYYRQEMLNEMGEKCILPKRSFKERTVCFFRRYLPRIR